MREILFRGKRIDNDEWAEGSPLVWPDGDAEICHTKPDVVHEMLKAVVYPETIGQYTGLTDKNGKKMSKHLGNTADPFELFDKYGADALPAPAFSAAIPAFCSAAPTRSGRGCSPPGRFVPPPPEGLF